MHVNEVLHLGKVRGIEGLWRGWGRRGGSGDGDDGGSAPLTIRSMIGMTCSCRDIGNVSANPTVAFRLCVLEFTSGVLLPISAEREREGGEGEVSGMEGGEGFTATYCHILLRSLAW